MREKLVMDTQNVFVGGGHMNTDMTQGAAMESMLRFAVPMVLGNLFLLLH